MKQFLLHLDDKKSLGRSFVLHDIDDTHLFISSDSVPLLQERIDELMDKLHFSIINTA